MPLSAFVVKGEALTPANATLMTLIIWGICLGVFAGACWSVLHRRVAGAPVRAMLALEAFEEAKALTLEELGLPPPLACPPRAAKKQRPEGACQNRDRQRRERALLPSRGAALPRRHSLRGKGKSCYFSPFHGRALPGAGSFTRVPCSLGADHGKITFLTTSKGRLTKKRQPPPLLQTQGACNLTTQRIRDII